MKISLLGYMGSGKSETGKLLAKELGLTFCDLDTEIEKENGNTISEIIIGKGELHFRKLENRKLQLLLQNDGQVTAMGGGTPCYYNNINLINENSTSVYLQLGVMDLYNRLEGKQHHRPLIAHLKGGELKEYIAKHLFERRYFYGQAHITIKASGKSNVEITKEIISLTHE